MTNKPKVLEIDFVNGTKIERDFTEKEVQEAKLRNIEAEEVLKSMLNKANARESALAKLAALGLTEEEIGAL
jgi:hypothetical protein